MPLGAIGWHIFQCSYTWTLNFCHNISKISRIKPKKLKLRNKSKAKKKNSNEKVYKKETSDYNILHFCGLLCHFLLLNVSVCCWAFSFSWEYFSFSGLGLQQAVRLTIKLSLQKWFSAVTATLELNWEIQQQNWKKWPQTFYFKFGIWVHFLLAIYLFFALWCLGDFVQF